MKRELGKITSADFILSRGFIPDVSVCFDFSGSGQFLTGWFVDTVFLVKLLQVFNAESMDDLVGKYAWVTHTNTSIDKIEPALAKEGKPFDIRKWGKWVESKPEYPKTGVEYDELDFS